MDTPPPTDGPKFTAWAAACVERGKEKFFRSAAASSAVSLADAQQQARTLARSRAEAAAAGHPPRTSDGGYPYPERVLVEPVLERLHVSAPLDPAGAPREIARLTRNSYDATVLNAYRVMFVDVDTVPDSSNTDAEKIISQANALSALVDLVHTQPDLQFRVYSTKAGLRYLCTSRLFDPVSVESQDILRRLKADPRYALLCRVQKCYRARLTPKYWRCLIKPERTGFFSRLLGSEQSLIDPARFSTCHYIETVGNAQSAIPPEIALILQKHDQLCEVGSAKPLA